MFSHHNPLAAHDPIKVVIVHMADIMVNACWEAVGKPVNLEELCDMLEKWISETDSSHKSAVDSF